MNSTNEEDFEKWLNNFEAENKQPYNMELAPISNNCIPCDGWGGPCDSMAAIRFRQNTKYIEEERNWVNLCENCQKSNIEYWDEMWRDYYGGR